MISRVELSMSNESINVQLMIVTHEQVGQALINAVKRTLGDLPIPTTVVTVRHDSDPDSLREKLRYFAQQLGQDCGMLVLTDLYGSTPSNIAKAIAQANIKVVAGLNLPMLLRVMNYPHLSVFELANKALTGGRDGIINCNELE